MITIKRDCHEIALSLLTWHRYKCVNSKTRMITITT